MHTKKKKKKKKIGESDREESKKILVQTRHFQAKILRLLQL